MLETGPMQ